MGPFLLKISFFSEPRTSILGTRELFIESGSTINLTCVIHTGGQAMDEKRIFWNYNGKVGMKKKERESQLLLAATAS